MFFFILKAKNIVNENFAFWFNNSTYTVTLFFECTQPALSDLDDTWHFGRKSKNIWHIFFIAAHTHFKWSKHPYFPKNACFDLRVLGHISKDNCPIELKFSAETENRKILEGFFRVLEGEACYEQNAPCILEYFYKSR